MEGGYPSPSTDFYRPVARHGRLQSDIQRFESSSGSRSYYLERNVRVCVYVRTTNYARMCAEDDDDRVGRCRGREGEEWLNRSSVERHLRSPH